MHFAVALFAPYFLLVKGCNNDRVNIEVIEHVLEVLFKNSTYVYVHEYIVSESAVDRLICEPTELFQILQKISPTYLKRKHSAKVSRS